MDWISKAILTILIFVSPHLVCLLLRKFGLRSKTTDQKPRLLPPGPPGLPIIGNLLDLGTLPHQSMAAMRAKYGDVVLLKFGQVKTMVVLSCKASTELFKNNDLVFADRHINETLRARGVNRSSLVFSDYGPYWRTLKRLLTSKMLTQKGLNETVANRRKHVNIMLRWIEEEGEKSDKGVPLAHYAFMMLTNLTGNFAFSRNLMDPESKLASELAEALDRLQRCIAVPNLADFFPILRRLDPQGLKRKMEANLDVALKLTSDHIKEREEERKQNKRHNDFLDVLLDYEGKGGDEPEKLTAKDIAIFLVELFIASVETSSIVIEWAMTELFLHPEVMDKLKTELGSVIGGSRQVEENDIDNLPYLQAVIKESMRLHPPAPLLLPRKANSDTTFMGYHIPKGTRVLVNTWSIGRDADVWKDPLSFRPERFLEECSNVDYKGLNYEFLPFGAGRRMCPGLVLGYRIVHVAIGSLVHELDWEFKHPVDVTERFGTGLRLATPLAAIPKRRLLKR